MTPRKIFLFGLCVMTLIFIVSSVFPDEIKMGTFIFRSPNLRTFFETNTKEYKDIQAIIASVDTVDFQFEDFTVLINDSTDNADIDSVKLKPNVVKISAENVYQFEYPPGQDTLLFPMFRAINSKIQRNKPIRILHYGDSQIECDRITATIRNYMQKNYGGHGVGFIPIVPVSDVAITFQKDVSPNWKRFSVLDRNSGTDNCFGIAGNFARYSPVNQDDSIAHIGLQPYYAGFRNVHTFTHARLFYGPSQNPFTVTINQVNTRTLPAHDNVGSAWWRFETPQNSLDLQLSPSCNLPDMYGIALDGERGVAVDNLPIRGSAGIDFSRMDTTQMREMFRMMDVEMLILQFGANVLTTFAGNNYDYYSRRFSRELHFLKSLKSGLVIIVIGVNDISQNTADGYKSHPNVVKIRDAQKRAAFEAGCVFWDLYEAMGGENSMPSWAFAEPPLAQKDFLHFNSGGAKIVGELFCKAWALEQ